jgi:ABC-type multidrug transport system ATPase subunit
MKMTMLSLCDISVKYPSAQDNEASISVLDGLSMDISRGDFVFLKGANGSGKTTLLKLLSGIIERTSGIIYAQGDSETPKVIRSKNIPKIYFLSVVHQNLDEAIVPIMSVGDHMAFKLYCKMRNIEFAQIKEQAREYLKLYRPLDVLLKRFDDPSRVLSGGWQQLLQIISAFWAKPDIVLLDEPTSHLAPEHSDFANEYIATESNNKAILYVSHAEPHTYISPKISSSGEMREGKIYGHKCK